MHVFVLASLHWQHWQEFYKIKGSGRDKILVKGIFQQVDQVHVGLAIALLGMGNWLLKSPAGCETKPRSRFSLPCKVPYDFRNYFWVPVEFCMSMKCRMRCRIVQKKSQALCKRWAGTKKTTTQLTTTKVAINCEWVVIGKYFDHEKKKKLLRLEP